MTEYFQWISENKQWLFSGIGVVALVSVWRLLRRWWLSRLTQSISLSPQPSPPIPWASVEIRGRFFAWDGPTLHALEARSPIQAPEEAIAALRAAGHTPSFGRTSKLREHLAGGVFQVFETDRASWRRELLYAQDGSQVLLVRPSHEAV